MWRRYSTFFGRDVRSDIEDEIKFHVEARARELVDAGWSPRAAEGKPCASLGIVTRS
jgi:hypothetical protein